MESIPALPVSPTRGVPPLFVKHSTFTSPVGGLDLCLAVEKVTGKDTVEGVQRMGDLYRIYLKNQDARDTALVNGITHNNCSISLLSHNPFQVRDQNSNTTKILIGNVPLSVDDSEIERALLEKDIVFKSSLKFETYRTPDGKWTHYKTGRRFFYAEVPKLNLNPFLQIGLWRASIFYREQIRPTKRAPADPPLSPPTDFASAVTADESSARASNNSESHPVTGAAPEVENNTPKGDNVGFDTNTSPSKANVDFFPVFKKKDEKLLNESRGKGETTPSSSSKSNDERGRTFNRRANQFDKLNKWSNSESRSTSIKRKQITLSPNDKSDQSRKAPKHNNLVNSNNSTASKS